ncbi:bifunctional 2-polyprenyl-6-hydroxyphenol methylase/3-demethylubiquinol 3-O-methyltransferase UbiG [Lacimicrobium sp. SS2-24]|uniref:bifunctional 2-polyprenyl-6-hydroxyphenol methylase/3-demethylubiquinol 3-O-methyltransferase UbiG n=1 Tax=Lacimicrobium sp. SS2-24 TaxID=2005569 RepID=UPI000B4AF678|nr:bifunctional 2-polyprenyl-6-hydroxyphenol methylase/3-demethylubiquinol 3-O-methyltransferase UbiG [Lacimicrobium sp. SS2-24]
MLDKSRLQPPMDNHANVSVKEIEKFNALAEAWWDPSGKFKTVLAFNQTRLHWIKQQIQRHVHHQDAESGSLEGLEILDIGCGGGLLAEPLALSGATVTGIDASGVSIEVAKRHAEKQGVSVEYRHGLASELLVQKRQFDVVINAEVVEHVPDQKQLIDDCCQLVRPGGLLLLATLNRTLKSFVVAIIGAEYVMNYLPRGTHDWRFFVKPDELRTMAEAHHTRQLASTGMRFNPFTQRWRCCASESVNYIQAYEKMPEG